MFKTEIINSKIDLGRDTAFNRTMMLFDSALSRIGFFILLASAVYFINLDPSVATFLILFGIMSLFIIVLIVRFSKRRRTNIGKITMTEESVILSFPGNEMIFLVRDLEDLKIYLRSELPEYQKITGNDYGNNWILFARNNTRYKYEFSIDSDFKKNRFDQLWLSLKEKFPGFVLIVDPEINLYDE